MSEDRKRRIAIVGGGPAGLSAAYHLTDTDLHPGWEDVYEVHVYQMGWRVGGKAATGRGPNERIQEHGIHVFGNMYFNTTRMVRDVFEQVDWDEHDKPYKTMEKAFLPSTRELESEYWGGRWHGQLGSFPDNDEVPWRGKIWPDARNIVQEVLDVVARHLGDALEGHHKAKRGQSWWSRLKAWFLRGVGHELTVLAKKVLEQVEKEAKEPHVPHRSHHIDAFRLLDDAVGLLKKLHEADPDNVGLRYALIDADLVVTSVRGVVDDDVIALGVDSIDKHNYREWLEMHGASEVTLRSAAPQALPNTSLAYAGGDTTKIPTMSAAAFVTFLLRQLSGKGAGAYFFREGTGETVVKPLYRLLEQRGVHFHFFHKLTEVVPDPDTRTIQRLRFDVQATPKADRYDPLRRIPDAQELVWPDRPILDRLEQGAELAEGREFPEGEGYDLESWWTAWEPVGELVLEKGEGFDEIVLATPISTLRYTCGEVLHHPHAGPKWSAMVDKLQSAATQAVQIWLDRPFTELGWEHLDGTDRYVGALYNQDLTSFCDFSDLVAEEHWPEDNRPKALLYLIGALSDPDGPVDFTDHDFPARQHERIKWATIQWLRNIDGLLPDASSNPIDPRSFDFDLMSAHDPDNRSWGVNQFDQQFWKANIDPNERYTLNVANTVQHRLKAWESGFDNLVLAGDWIYTGFNVGSFEGAIMSGKLASLALTGRPHPKEVYGYDFLHTDGEGPSEWPIHHWPAPEAATADEA